MASNGKFFVKSAYFVDYEMKRLNRGQSSNAAGGKVPWKKVWALQVPRKVKQVLWKSLNDILPTKCA